MVDLSFGSHHILAINLLQLKWSSFSIRSWKLFAKCRSLFLLDEAAVSRSAALSTTMDLRNNFLKGSAYGIFALNSSFLRYLLPYFSNVWGFSSLIPLNLDGGKIVVMTKLCNDGSRSSLTIFSTQYHHVICAVILWSNFSEARKLNLISPKSCGFFLEKARFLWGSLFCARGNPPERVMFVGLALRYGLQAYICAKINLLIGVHGECCKPCFWLRFKHIYTMFHQLLQFCCYTIHWKTLERFRYIAFALKSLTGWLSKTWKSSRSCKTSDKNEETIALCAVHMHW